MMLNDSKSLINETVVDSQSNIDNESVLDKEYMDNLNARFERLSKENYIKSREKSQNSSQEQRLSKSYEEKTDIRENCINYPIY